MTESGNEPRRDSDQPRAAWSWLNFLSLDAFSLNQNESSKPNECD